MHRPLVKIVNIHTARSKRLRCPFQYQQGQRFQFERPFEATLTRPMMEKDKLTQSDRSADEQTALVVTYGESNQVSSSQIRCNYYYPSS